jgi:hypothetical protein
MSENIKKADAIQFLLKMGFDGIIDLAVINGIECVGKKWPQEPNQTIYWPIQREGSGFERLARGFSTWIYPNDLEHWSI